MPALNNLAAAKIKEKDYKGAIEEYTKLIKQQPDYGFAYINRGIAYEELRMQKEACADWNKAKELGLKVADTFLSDCK